MKKILLLLLLSFICFGCSDYHDITDFIFIDSLYIKYNNEESLYEIKLHFSNPNTLITQEQSSGSTIKHETFESKNKTINDALQDVNNNLSGDVNLGLIKSVILDKSMLSNTHIDNFIKFQKTTDKLYPTFNVFCFIDDEFKIYDINNPKDVSPYYSLIGLSNDIYTINMLPFSKFVSSYLIDEFSLNIPIISYKDDLITQDENKVSIYISGLISFNKKRNSYNSYLYEEYKGLNFINCYDDKNVIINDNINDITINLSIEKYIIDRIIHKNELNLDIKVICNNLYKTPNIDYRNIIKDYINKELSKLLNDSIRNNDKLIETKFDYIFINITTKVILT